MKDLRTPMILVKGNHIQEKIAIKKKGLSIRTKILLGFVVIIVLSGLGELYSIRELCNLSGINNTLYDQHLSIIRTILSADADVAKIQHNMKIIEFASTSADLETAIASLDYLTNDLDNQFKIIRKWVQEERESGSFLFVDLEKLFNNWRTESDEITAVARFGNQQLVTALIKDQKVDQVGLLHVKIEKLENHVAEKAHDILLDSQHNKNKAIGITATIFLTTILISGLFAFLFSKTITDSIKRLIKGMSEFSRGNLNHRVEVKSRDEIEWLANSFNHMVEEQKTAIAELKLHDEIMTHMGEGVCLVKADSGTILYTNPKIEEMYGYNPGDLGGMSISQLWLKKEKNTEEIRLAMTEASETRDGWRGETMNIRKDASLFWCYTCLSDFEHIKYGKVIIAVQKDITDQKKMEDELDQYRLKLEEKVVERTVELNRQITRCQNIEAQIKASLKEKEILLQEIHHRVKNNMQIIVSLLKLQLHGKNKQDVNSVLKENIGRIYSMAAIHESLYKSEKLNEIELKAYLQRLSQALLETFIIDQDSIIFQIDMPEQNLSIEIANPLGLVLNELISNSLKYAFPNGCKGMIRISSNLLNGNEIEMIVADNGVGMPEDFDWGKIDTLGLKLVKDIIERQLNGKINFENRNGTRFTINFDLESQHNP